MEKLKKKDKSRDSFVIVVHEKAVGKISIRNIIPKLSGRTSSWIGKEHRGKGIVTEARTLATNYWFKKYKLVRIEAGTRIYNKAAQRSLEKSGYKLEGRLRKRILTRMRHTGTVLRRSMFWFSMILERVYKIVQGLGRRSLTSLFGLEMQESS